MSHEHQIVDSESRFLIDPITRSITNQSGKTVISQYDHNSERYTFEIPRYIEDHDMFECNRIEVHFTNITRNKKTQNSDVYLVSSRDVVSNRDSVYFSWLVSREATQLVGSLKFSIAFKCTDTNGKLVYDWGTDIFDGIQVIERYEHISTVIEKHPDLVETIKREIVDELPSSGGEIDYSKIEEMVEEYLTANPPIEGDAEIIVQF